MEVIHDRSGKQRTRNRTRSWPHRLAVVAGNIVLVVGTAYAVAIMSAAILTR